MATARGRRKDATPEDVAKVTKAKESKDAPETAEDGAPLSVTDVLAGRYESTSE
ncbi:hypothetical protein [Streptosporangium sp. NPDC002524]|uniref:hypothetical protein n=1 Tax=Streptosporangium sp. NPDC002524 TaxID=3154537 RepID=UPI0033322E8F